MSFSLPLDEGPMGGLEDRMNKAIYNLQEGSPGREEAEASASLLCGLVRDLASRIGAENFTASVGGHRDANNSMMVNATVFRKELPEAEEG